MEGKPEGQQHKATMSFFHLKGLHLLNYRAKNEISIIIQKL